MSEVILDTITGKSTATTITIGSTPVVSASANSMTIRGEGSNQTSIQQGLGKGWCHFTGGTATLEDSFNIGSLTDTAAGRFTLNFSTNFGSGNYVCVCGMVGNDGTTTEGRSQMVDATPTTSAFAFRNVNLSDQARDETNHLMALFGDLS